MNGNRRLIAGGLIAGGLMLGAAGLVIAAGVAKADTNVQNYPAATGHAVCEMHSPGDSQLTITVNVGALDTRKAG